MGIDQKALNALAKGAGVTAIGMALSKALSYLYRIVIARGVGPEAYGQLSLGIMVIGLASTLGYLSLGVGLKKFLPEFRVNNEKEKIRGAVISAIAVSLPVSILLAAFVFLSADLIAVNIFENPKISPLIKILSFHIVIGNLSKTFFDTTLGFNKIIYKTATVRVIQNLVKLSATVALLILGFDVASAAWGWMAGTLVSATLGLYFMEKKVGPILFSRVKPDFQFGNLLRFSLPLLLSGIIGTVLGWADTGLLGYYMNDLEVGLYNAALPTAMLILLPHKAIGSLALSSFSELKDRDEESLQGSLQTATRWIFSLVLPTFLVLLLFSEQVLAFLFGTDYVAASFALSVLAFGYLIDAMVGQVGNLLNSKGYTKYIFYNNVAALVLNLILNMALIPIYGILGAAIATASSTILTNLLMFLEVWRKEKIVSLPTKKILEITTVGVIPLMLVGWMDSLLFKNTPFWFVFPAGGLYYLIYAAVFLKVIGLQEAEKNVLLRTGEKIGYRDEIEKILDKLE